jgi:hypothetical protein
MILSFDMDKSRPYFRSRLAEEQSLPEATLTVRSWPESTALLMGR